jgi:hypothetical protein
METAHPHLKVHPVKFRCRELADAEKWIEEYKTVDAEGIDVPETMQ